MFILAVRPEPVEGYMCMPGEAWAACTALICHHKARAGGFLRQAQDERASIERDLCPLRIVRM